MEDILATTAKFLGVKVGPLSILIYIAVIGFLFYIVWEDRDYAMRYFGLRSVWQLYLRLIGFLVFVFVAGAIWRKFIDLDWYFDVGIWAGIGALVWFAYFKFKNRASRVQVRDFFSGDPNRTVAMRYMVQEPALAPAWNALKSGDDQDAFKLLQYLADAGNPGAQNNLGIMYEAGVGVERSDSQAEFWYRKASEEGSCEAQYQLGTILTADMIHPPPVVRRTDEPERALEGYMWLYMSALKEHKGAKVSVKRLKRIMSRDQIETAKRMAAQRLSNVLRQRSNQKNNHV